MPSFLTEHGWNDAFAASFEEFINRQTSGATHLPARVMEEHKEAYRLATPCGDYLGKVRGSLRHDARSRGDFPAVGDWVVAQREPGDSLASISFVLPRRTKLSRKAAGASEEQIIGTNVDRFLITTSLNLELNLRRLERYLVAVWDAGAEPIIVLAKADLASDVARYRSDVERVAPGVRIVTVSALQFVGLEELRSLVPYGTTAALLGSSGVGKSTIVNALLASREQDVQAISGTGDKGRHTTVSRSLIKLPNGGWLMDTPGMREFQPWTQDAGLGQTFSDVESIANTCRFRDCRHESEPGCAVLAAIAQGELAGERLASMRKLEREEAYLVRRRDKSAAAAERDKWKRVHKALRRSNRQP